MLSLGGTKNGMLAGEAVVLFGDARTDDLAYVRKQSGQLASKMRFISAQFVAMYEGDLWRRAASASSRRSSSRCSRATCGARARPTPTSWRVGSPRARRPRASRSRSPSQANEVFALLPDDAIPELQERFHFYAWEEGLAEGRSLGALGHVLGHDRRSRSTSWFGRSRLARLSAP